MHNVQCCKNRFSSSRIIFITCQDIFISERRYYNIAQSAHRGPLKLPVVVPMVYRPPLNRLLLPKFLDDRKQSNIAQRLHRGPLVLPNAIQMFNTTIQISVDQVDHRIITSGSSWMTCALQHITLYSALFKKQLPNISQKTNQLKFFFVNNIVSTT